MQLRYPVPALALTLALAGQPALAQGHRGGGSRGGSVGGSHGSYRGTAVARHPSAGPRSGAVGGSHYGSRPGYAPRGGVAGQRHPRAGTGHGYGYYPGHGYYRGGHRYYRPYYGYRPYSPYYSYYPYYSSYWPGVSLSFGWGYGSSWPYGVGVGGYYDSRGDSVGVRAPDVGEGPTGRVRLEVRPDDASVYVDDAFRGTAREARILRLPPGRHVIELVRPGFAVERREVTVVGGESQDVLVELPQP